METNIYQIEEPENLSRWNWGAFLFSGLWGLFNGIYWPICVSVALMVLGAIVPADFQIYSGIVINLVNLIIAIYLGVMGREQAWLHKEWSSVEAFEKTQRNWTRAGFIVLGVCVVFGFIAVLLMF